MQPSWRNKLLQTLFRLSQINFKISHFWPVRPRKSQFCCFHQIYLFSEQNSTSHVKMTRGGSGWPNHRYASKTFICACSRWLWGINTLIRFLIWMENMRGKNNLFRLTGDGKRTEWKESNSVCNHTSDLQNRESDLLMTSMITDRTGLHDVLLPITITVTTSELWK